MKDVVIGVGNLDGRGVYAARDFHRDEIVLQYDWRELSPSEWQNLPAGEKQFAHSFWGKIQLFCAPAKYVNHLEQPNTRQDLKNRCDRALRPIKQGEEITTDAEVEIHNELESLLEIYRNALGRCDFQAVVALTAKNAELVVNGSGYKGMEAILAGYKSLYGKMPTEAHVINAAHWLFTSYDLAICNYAFEAASSGRGIIILKREDGSWRIVCEHFARQTRQL